MYCTIGVLFALSAAVAVKIFAPYACGSGIPEVSTLRTASGVCVCVNIILYYTVIHSIYGVLIVATICYTKCLL